MPKPGSTAPTSVAIIGGGINGLCCAWQLALRGAKVTLFERGALLGETSRQTTKLLHGGLCQMENGELRLVTESLRERRWWLQNCPELCREVRITIPVYNNSPRARWQINSGLHCYQLLAGTNRLRKHRWIPRDAAIKTARELHTDNLAGAFRYSEVQMDDTKLGQWVAQQARAAGAQLMENSPIQHVGLDGSVHLDSYQHRFDFIVNATGPWLDQLTEQSGLRNKNKLDLVRSSHLVFDGTPSQSFMLQTSHNGHCLFVLPWLGQTLVGSTETRQTADEPVTVSDEEIDYLLHQYNRYFRQQRGRGDIVAMQTGLRPLVKSAAVLPHKIGREYLLERQQRLLTVFGGQWTTARALGEKVAAQLLD